MCRKNQLWGWMLTSFGLGVLVGSGIETGFWGFCGCLGLMLLGISICKGK